jgi:adenosylhomocysteinase
VKTVRNNIEEYHFHDGRKVYLLAEGRLVNLAAGDGHPAEIMDLTFALQALSLKYTYENKLSPGVYSVPTDIDNNVALIRLKSENIVIDQLTDEQKSYLDSWKHS